MATPTWLLSTRVSSELFWKSTHESCYIAREIWIWVFCRVDFYYIVELLLKRASGLICLSALAFSFAPMYACAVKRTSECLLAKWCWCKKKACWQFFSLEYFWKYFYFPVCCLHFEHFNSLDLTPSRALPPVLVVVGRFCAIELNYAKVDECTRARSKTKKKQVQSKQSDQATNQQEMIFKPTPVTDRENKNNNNIMKK